MGWECLALLLSMAWAGSSLDAKSALQPPQTVDFHKEILPILSRRCASCHVGQRVKGGLRMDTRAGLIRGGDSGPALIPGKSEESPLLQLTRGDDPERIMPANGNRLSADELAKLRSWIDQGAPWEEGLTLSEPFKTAALAPRRVKPPDQGTAGDSENAIDRLLAGYYRSKSVEPGPLVSDRVFARRVSLDLVGLLPSVEEVSSLEHDTRPNKRALYIQAKLSDRENYAEHWLTFWNDALRNAYRGTGFIDDGRRQITGWLYKALFDNLPYDQFVKQLLSPVAGSDGFVYGIQWRGVVNASQRREMQAAQSIGQVFLGINLKCASCHDSFINNWKLKDAYSLANVFSDEPLEIHRCDKPTGETATTAFLFPELGSIDPRAPRAERLSQLAAAMTNPKNGRLTRTIVNRLWTRLLGRGLVEPVDEMDQDPWNSDLLDWLATDLQDHGYDLKHTLSLICESRAYQSVSMGAQSPDQKAFVFRGPVVKRMDAEQFRDAVSQLTTVWPEVTPSMLKKDGRSQGGQFAATLATAQPNGKPLKAPESLAFRWIWSHSEAARSDPGGRVVFRKEFQLDSLPQSARGVATCDNEFTLFVNGRRVAASDQWNTPAIFDLTRYLRQGKNLIAIEAVNWPDPPSGKGKDVKGNNPAGLAFLAAGWNGENRVWKLSSDDTWSWSKSRDEGWQRSDSPIKDWKPAAALPALEALVWSMSRELSDLVQSTPVKQGSKPVRAALADDDELLRALGRPNREQVVTRRDSVATTLQALEMTNGGTLDSILKAGADHWLPEAARSSRELIAKLYQIGLSRAPTASEQSAAGELLGQPPTHDGLQDLLWSILMLPEFQLID